MVVSSNPLASQAGVDVMREGGNAIDAAVSVSFALAVVHPIAGNVGGGGFLLYHDAETGREISVDYREMAPAAAGRDMYLDAAGEVVPELSTVGYLASGVPGSVAGLHLAWSRFGTLPWSRLLEPAIDLARNGFVVEDHFSRSLEAAVPLLERFDESRRIFLPGGSPPVPGQTFTQPDLARTLEAIARDGAQAFYRGEIAELIERDMEAHAGIMTREDLANYVARIRPPVRGRYRGCEVVSMGPPSSGGVILIEMLNMLELAGLRQESTARFHLLAECMRRAFADRAATMGDADFAEVPVDRLLSREHARERLEDLDEVAATESRQVAAGPLGEESPQTTHLSVVDPEGSAVAITTTINGNFGSGVTVKGAGFLLNNEMDDFTSRAGVPNMFGLIQGEANAIAPGKRPLSAMTPTLVKQDGKVLLVLGSPGGPAIINTVLQIILNVLDEGMDLYEAVDEPRIHHQWMPDRIVAETGALSREVEAELESLGHEVVYRGRIGDAHCIRVDPVSGLREGVADPRLWGEARGF
jgi:gamma-glutamyltranspeptidase/glutathione hydrolase